MPPRDTHTRHALSRARWAILQTGLITSGIALFGVYVLGCRDAKFFIMNWHLRRWIAVGPLIVGTVCASGYLIGAQWTGLRVRGWLYAAVLLLQVTSFIAAHYAEYATFHPIWRDTREPIPFVTYANFVALSVGSEYNKPHLPPWLAYTLSGLQLIQFSLLAICSPLLLSRKPHCTLCGGVLHQRIIGSINSPGDIPRLAHFATLTDPAPLQSLLRPQNSTPRDDFNVALTRCVVCQQGRLKPPANLSAPIDLSRKLLQGLWTPPPAA